MALDMREIHALVGKPGEKPEKGFPVSWPEKELMEAIAAGV